MIKPFTPQQLLTMKPEALIAILSEQLALVNQAQLAQAEELKQLRTLDNKAKKK
jgi:hypothetical protein